MTSFIKSWKEMGVRKEPWEVCELKNTFFTLEHKLGKKKHQKSERERSAGVVCLLFRPWANLGRKKKKKQTTWKVTLRRHTPTFFFCKEYFYLFILLVIKITRMIRPI